jgi:hypothetical protein
MLERVETAAPPVEVRVVLDWFAELRAKIPPSTR